MHSLPQDHNSTNKHTTNTTSTATHSSTQQTQQHTTTDITDMKRQQVATTTTVSTIEEGGLLDGLRSRVTRRVTNYSILFFKCYSIHKQYTIALGSRGSTYSIDIPLLCTEIKL